MFDFKSFYRCKVSPFLFIALISAFLSGCGAGNEVANLASDTISGVVMGGRQPIKTGSLYVLATGKNGNNNASTVIATATTDANGRFSISAFNGSQRDGDLITIHSADGDATGSGNNDTIRMMSVLGVYSSTAGLNYSVNLNELSTVAALFVFKDNMQSGNCTYVILSKNCLTIRGNGSTAWDAKVTQFNALVTSSSGAFAGAISATSQAILSIEASVLANCVNSTGGTYTVTSTACGNLFSQVGIASTATNTVADALLNIQAHTTGATTADQATWAQTIFALVPAQPVYPQSTFTSSNRPTTLVLN